MRHILQWIFVFAAALAALLTLQSCGLEEPFNTPQTSVTEGVVELVARPVSYNNHDVTTKADGGFNDAAIHNAFLILFNTDGQRILFEEINIADGQLSAKIDKGLGDVTACILANVPADFARGITGLEGLNTAVLDLVYSNPSKVNNVMGIPAVDLDSDTTTESVPCIPMFGQKDVDLTTSPPAIGIELKRLFAKATVSLKMNLTNSGSGMQANSYIQMTSYSICDLPNKVKLIEPTGDDYESAWIKDAGTVSVSQSNSKIYNQAASGVIVDLPKELVFDCYVPEYYLLPKPDGTEGYGNEKYKPKMYDYDSKNPKHPIYIQLAGSYEPVSGVSQNLIYKIYLGENNATSFTLKRNTYYKNYLVIQGVENNKDGENGNIDHRVEVSLGDVVSIYGEVANCYMIGKEGTYNFPAYKGAYKYAQLKDAPKCTSKNAKILIKDNDGIWLKNENISVATDELTQEQIITIKVTDGDNTEGEDITIGASGNAILALCDDDGNIEWSWHLWFTGGLNWNVANMEFFEMDTQAYPSGVQMMDRNLGSHPSATQSGTPGVATGLYYKYGDKNPYISSGYVEGSTYGALTWDPSEDANEGDDTKAVNDPCPPGYKVPSSNVWSGNATKEHADENFLVYQFTAFRFWNNGTTSMLNGSWDYLLDDIYYPYSGYVASDTSVSTGERKDENTTELVANDYSTFTIQDIRTNESVISSREEDYTLIRYKVETLSYNEYRYTDFKFRTRLQTQNIGYIWGEDKTFLMYYKKGNNWDDFQIIHCKQESRAVTRERTTFYEYKNTGSFWRPNYQWVLSDRPLEFTDPQVGEWGNARTITNNSTEKIPISSEIINGLSEVTYGLINNQDWQSRLKSNQARRKYEDAKIISFETVPDLGYQVRCVKE